MPPFKNKNGKRTKAPKSKYGKYITRTSSSTKRPSYGNYMPKKTSKGYNSFKRYAQKVVTAASEAKIMTCIAGAGGYSNIPYSSIYNPNIA